jgi:hypothetical protein
VKIVEIMPILENVPSPIVFDHLAHIPEPEGANDPLFSKVRALIDKGKPGSNCRAPIRTPRSGRPPTPIRPRSRRLMRRPRPNAACGAATGRIRANVRRSPTTPSSSILFSSGRQTRRSATVFWSRTRLCSTISRRAREPAPSRPGWQAAGGEAQSKAVAGRSRRCARRSLVLAGGSVSASVWVCVVGPNCCARFDNLLHWLLQSGRFRASFYRYCDYDISHH